MCVNCEKLEAEIADLQRLADPAFDLFTLAILKEALALAERDKAAIVCDDLQSKAGSVVASSSGKPTQDQADLIVQVLIAR